MSYPSRLVQVVLLVFSMFYFSACTTDVSITGVARCDGVAQAGESPVDSLFDADGDGFFDAANPDCADIYAEEFLDCDDGNEDVNPAAPELECNDIDDDCDPETPDGYDADMDGVLACDDCDDQDADNYPGNAEICDGLDNDCDGVIEVDGADEDGDGWRICAGDCDDTRADAYEGALELCNGLDEDCNGLSDFDAEGEADGDLDGSLSCEDCDDQDAENFPGNTEVCDGADNDCNHVADADAAGEVDGDNDGALSCSDCDDGDPDNYPGNTEVCDGADNDCDVVVPNTEIDDDGDLYVECDWFGTSGGVVGGLDCDDTPGSGAARHPGNTEVCDGIDNDCVGGVPATETDDDGDGYVECVWMGGSSAVLGGLDCDDTPGSGAGRSPGLTEICGDGIDNNCADGVDEGCGTGSTDYSGTWILTPAIAYYCALGMVNISLNSLQITDAYPSILVSGLPLGTTQPGSMSGTFSSPTEFVVSSFLSGAGIGCDETYTMTGEFTSLNTLTATITADFYAPPTSMLGCGDPITFTPECLAQSWNVIGTR